MPTNAGSRNNDAVAFFANRLWPNGDPPISVTIERHSRKRQESIVTLLSERPMRYRNSTLFTLAALATWSSALAGDSLPTDALAAQVDAMFEEYDRPDSAGCALGIIQGGQLVYSKGFGSANLDHEVPNTPRTVFDTGSLTKSVTCACLAILLDQGKISPQDDIRKYLPELHAFEPPIRIQHLVRCRDGIWAQWHTNSSRVGRPSRSKRPIETATC